MVQANSWLSGIDADVGAQLSQITALGQQTVTLTSASGKIPFSISNALDYPVRVLLDFQSPKLHFVNGNQQMVTIPAGQPAHLTIPVTVRASGAFSMQVTISSPDRRLPIAHTRFDVRSTAISGIGLVLTVAAGLFLALWWARNARNTRRAARPGGLQPPRAADLSYDSPTRFDPADRPGGAMPGVRIVTDSSCDLSLQEAADLGVVVVPLTIRFGDQEFVDLEELTVADFYRRMAESPTLPETAAPAPGEFEQAFRRLADEGADAIVCINLSSSCRPPSSRPATRPGRWPTPCPCGSSTAGP